MDLVLTPRFLAVHRMLEPKFNGFGFYCLTGFKVLSNDHIAKFQTYDDKIIKPVGGYYTERSAFVSRRIGNVVAFISYINITTAIPESTFFADTQRSSIYGTIALVDISTMKAYPCGFNAGKINSDVAIPVGYYYVIGNAICMI